MTKKKPYQRSTRPSRTYRTPDRIDSWLPQKDKDGNPIFRPVGWTPYEEQKHRHGGARPGAGAPRGNTNALKTGRYSKRYERALYMLAAIPELRFLMQTLTRRDTLKDRSDLRAIYAAALHAVHHDPHIEETIKDLVYQRLADASVQIQKKQTALKLLRATQNSQTINRPRRPIQYRNRPHHGHFGLIHTGPTRRALLL